MSFIGPLLPANPPRASGRFVSADIDAKVEDDIAARPVKRGKDRVKRRTKVTPAILAMLAELYAERLAVIEAYSAEAVAARLGVHKSTVWKAWCEVKRKMEGNA